MRSNIHAMLEREWSPMNGYGTVLASIILTFAACQSLPHFSGSGEVRDIAINDRLSAAAIQVHGGDEIRWTNKLITPVRITFSDYVLDKLSCRNNLSGHFYSGAETVSYQTKAPACVLTNSGRIRYIVRMNRQSKNRNRGQVQVRAVFRTCEDESASPLDTSYEAERKESPLDNGTERKPFESRMRP